MKDPLIELLALVIIVLAIASVFIFVVCFAAIGPADDDQPRGGGMAEE